MWNRNFVDCVQITMAENFGVAGRGAFYEEAGAIRDVMQNHLLQVLANVAMEPPPGTTDTETVRDEKVKVLKAIRPLQESDVIRGQFKGYHDEKGVAPGFQSGDVCRREALHQFLALAGSAVLSSDRQKPAGDLYRSIRQIPASAADLRWPHAACELFSFSAQS